MDQAIGPVAVRQCGLQSIAVTGQSLGNNIVELDLAISATRLLVGQNILQTQHVTAEFGDIVLGLINSRQALLQITQ